ncbi:MAG: RNA-binding domain-containing protein [Patescibacteria group bacterium]
MTFKRSPIVLIRNFVLIEFSAVVLFSIGTFIDPDFKYQAYSFLPLSSIFSYEDLKFLLLSVTQFIITIYAFLNWHYESFTVRPGSLSHSSGVFFKKDKNLPLEKSMSLTLSLGPLGKIFHYGSINIENAHSQKSMVLKNISRHENISRAIQQCIDPHTKVFQNNPDVTQILSEEEHEKLEFKSSLRFDQKMGSVNREIEKSAMKTIAAFLNTKGGYLVLGVNDEREPVGLTGDYKTLHRENRDGFENHFTQIYNSMIGPEFRHLVNLNFQDYKGHDICIIQAARSPRPIYLKVDDNEHFYVRTGNVTTPLKLSEVELYSRSRWPRRTSNA